VVIELDLKDQVNLFEFRRDFERLTDGEIIVWDELFPHSPIKAEILAIEEVIYKDCDYRDIIIFTTDFVSCRSDREAPRPRWRHFSIQINPMSASICPACHGMWVVAIPNKGVAHLHFRERAAMDR